MFELNVDKSISRLLDPTIPRVVVFTKVLTPDICLFIFFQLITKTFSPNILANFFALSYVLLVRITFGAPSFKSEYTIDLDAPPAPRTTAGPRSAFQSGAN